MKNAALFSALSLVCSIPGNEETPSGVTVAPDGVLRYSAGGPAVPTPPRTTPRSGAESTSVRSTAAAAARAEGEDVPPLKAR